MSNTSSAWLIETNSGHQFAIAEYELIEYIMEPERHEIPLTPVYASSILLWQDSMVPVIDFSLLINQQQTRLTTVSILAYQTEPGLALNYIGVELNRAPVKITIEDNQICEAQDSDNGLWASIANSWITHQQQPTPIINIASLDTAEFSDFVKTLTTQTNAAEPLVKLVV